MVDTLRFTKTNIYFIQVDSAIFSRKHGHSSMYAIIKGKDLKLSWDLKMFKNSNTFTELYWTSIIIITVVSMNFVKTLTMACMILNIHFLKNQKSMLSLEDNNKQKD